MGAISKSKFIAFVILAMAGYGIHIASPVETCNITSNIQMQNGMPVLTINGIATAPIMVWSNSNTFLQKTASCVKAAGIHLYTFSPALPWPRENGEYDFSAIDSELEILLKNDPQGLFMARIWLDPPKGWKQENPLEMPVWENNKILEDDQPSVTSEKWLEDVCRHCDALVKHLEQNWGKHIFAYHPTAMNSGEWYYTSTIWTPPDLGLRHFEGSFRNAFQRWLKKQYGEITTLNKAWRSNYMRFEDIDVPAPAVRKSTQHGLLRNPFAERNMIDFTQFQSVAITDAIKRISETFRSASGHKKLIYIFYGYTFELAGLQEGIAHFGQLNLGQAIQDKGADVWCAPMGYYDRRNGGSGPIMAPVESINCMGQTWCNEDDLRTHLSSKDAGWGRVDSLEETLWCHRRNFMATLVHRSQMWFFDFGQNWLGDQAIWNNIGVMQGLYQELYADPFPLQSDVAVIVDEKSMMHIAYGIEIGLPLLYDLRAQINRMGTTPEMWLLADYLKDRVKNKKLVIFLNAFCLTDHERTVIKNQLKADGATALWFYAPGIMTPDASSMQKACGVEGIEAVTGIKVTERTGEHAPAMRLVPGNKYAIGLGETQIIEPDDIVKNWKSRDESFQFRQMPFPPRKKLYPLFAVADVAAQPIGHYSDGTDVAMAVKQNDGFKSIFVGGLTLPAIVFANIAADAGVHLYCPPGDVIYTDGRFLSITACRPGAKTITLPGPSVVTDVYHHENVFKGRFFSIDLRQGETRIYRINRQDER